jgi:hypothetical protein
MVGRGGRAMSSQTGIPPEGQLKEITLFGCWCARGEGSFREREWLSLDLMAVVGPP